MCQAIELSNIHIKFQNFELKNISFNLPQGYILGLVGSNGAGKTTLIKIMTNMINQYQGTVSFWGKSLKSMPELFHRIGVVSDFHSLDQNWTLAKAANFTKFYFPTFDHQLFNQYVKRLSLNPQQKIKKLSRGQQVKASLALTLSRNCDLLILDEPTSGLDVMSRDELVLILQEYVSNENKSVLFSTHIVSDLEKCADYLVLINDGRILFNGETEQLRSCYKFVQCDANELTQDIKEKFLTYRSTPSHFEGLINTQSVQFLPSSAQITNSDLESIIVGLQRRYRHD